MHTRDHCWLLIGWVGLSWINLAATVRADSPNGRVYLSGQVHRQGAIDIPEEGGLTVVKAIILDGGLGDLADKKHIKIIRKMVDGTTQVIPINWSEIVGNVQSDDPVKAHWAKDVAVQAGDIIVVPEKVKEF